MPYLARETEALLVEAYRLWCWGIIEDQQPRLAEVSSLYRSTLGEREGRLAFDALANFVNTLGSCSTCPLKTSRSLQEFAGQSGMSKNLMVGPLGLLTIAQSIRRSCPLRPHFLWVFYFCTRPKPASRFSLAVFPCVSINVRLYTDPSGSIAGG